MRYHAAGARCFASLGLPCALRPMALSVRMESYLRIRNNVFVNPDEQREFTHSVVARKGRI